MASAAMGRGDIRAVGEGVRDAGPGLALQHEKSGGGAAPKEAEEWPVWLEGHGVDGMRGEKLPGQMASWLHEV